jgi:hypothetical protein
VRFFLLSTAFFGLLGGILGVAFTLISYFVNPQLVAVGGGPDPAGVSVLFFISWGFAGTCVGAFIGLIGAFVIALRF